MKKILIIILISISCNLFSQNELAKIEPEKSENLKPNNLAEPIKTDSVKKPTLYKEVTNKDCVYFQNAKTDKESYLSTKMSLVYLNDYAGNIDRIYFALIKKNDVPELNIQFMYKDAEEELNFKRCFDKNSKIEFILKNGVVIKLLRVKNNEKECLKIDKFIEGSKKQYATLSGSFKLLSENIASLKDSPIASMEVFFVKTSQEYIFQKSVFLESDNQNFEPSNYFVKYLQCIDN